MTHAIPSQPRARSASLAVGRARPASSGAQLPPSASHGAKAPVRLGWSDPVTGERLSVVLDAHPEMLQRLQEEGFCVEPEIIRTAS